MFPRGAHILLAVLVWSVSAALPDPNVPQPHPAYSRMLDAAQRMQEAERALYERKLSLGLFDAALDPHHTGLIGVEYSRITTTIGSLRAKRTSANPDFAAYIVRLLLDHGVGSGDSVLVTMTGSFPALNLAVACALEVLDVRCLRICSLGASSYGANQEEFTWLDMEDFLVRSGRLAHRSDYVSLGGSGDVGGGLPEGGRTLLRRRTEKLGYSILKTRSFKRQAALRRELFGDPEKYALLINIGGNQVMLGKGAQGRELPGGWIDPSSDSWNEGSDEGVEGVIFDFLEAGIPVLNLLHIEDIASSAGLPFDPEVWPEPGESAIYFISSPPRSEPEPSPR
jgi:poly-gamma-glutamate system protein